MNTTRRELLIGAAGMSGILSAAKAFGEPGGKSGIRLGICDWCCGVGGPAAMDVARDIGLEGVQISPSGAAARLSYADPAVQAAYRTKSKQTGIAVSSLAITVANEFPIASDPRGAAWMEQSIDAAHDLGSKAILVAFFGNGDLTDGKELKSAEIDSVAGKLKDVTQKAKKQGVVLGIESYLPASELQRIMDRVGSDAVGVYYDIANSTVRGYDVPAEIRQLKGRICEFHFKDNQGVLGTSVAFEPICEAIRGIGYKGWVIFEQEHGPDRVGYFRQNAALTRRALGMVR